ncbi:MAG: response regulator transcription factor [Eubacterium sp.]|nr:response regulator transcription factor [Eubacterium sp.]MDD7210477.1 response regulator transcription factor [Lachnospiraceae bacterium]MDY5497883.1 response regulator transcription factor [Anaerobutyricum sp.]
MLTNRLLIVNQNESACREMADYFQDSGYNVIWCTEYDEAVDIFLKGKSKPDVLMVDVLMPGRKEYEFLDKVRNFSEAAITIVSEDQKLDSQLYAYSKKIDDYIVKPVPMPLLEAHVEALMRRTSHEKKKMETAGALSIDYEGRKIYLNHKALKVTAKEFDLLEYFMKHRGMILSRDKILDSVWGYDYIGNYRSVDTLVKKIRAKLTKEYPYIRTVYGVGYCFDVQE